MDPDKVRGNIQRPYGPQEPEQSDKIDPEKFKKVMKVEDTDEAQKRHKRNLSKEEEEGDDEEVQGKEPQSPTTGSFSEFMSDKEDLDNVFDSKSGGVRYQATPEEDESFVAPKPGEINTEGVEIGEEEAPPQGQQPSQASSQQQQPPPSAPPAQQPTAGGYTQEPPPPTEESFSPPLYEGNFEEQPPNQQQLGQPQQQDQGQAPTDEVAPSTQQAQEPQDKENGGDHPSSKKKEEDSSLLASQPKVSDLMPKKKKTTAKKPAPEVRKLPKKEQTPQEAKKSPEGTGIGKTGKLDEAPLPESKLEQEQPSTSFEGIKGDKETNKEDQAIGNTPLGEETTKAGATSEKMGDKGALAQPGKTPEKVGRKEESPFQRLTPQEVRKQRLSKEGETATSSLEGMVVPSAGEGQKGESGKDKKDDDSPFIEASAESASITLPLFETPIAPVAPTSETLSYTRLTPEVHELFEKMGGVMIVQLDKGVTTTTMNINMPNSVFNGTQVILEQYSTAPHSYNLQLIGNPEAVKLFTSNMDELENSFKQANFNFEVNILNPSITQSKKPPHLIRRGSGAGGKGDGGSGKKKK